MAICTPLDNQSICECFGSRGPIPGRFNCQACCAFREAIFWRNGTHIVECR